MKKALLALWLVGCADALHPSATEPVGPTPSAAESSAPVTITRLPMEGWDGTTVVQTDKLDFVKTSDGISYEVNAGRFVTLEFENIPTDSTVMSVKLHATYDAEAGFAAGAALWQVGGGTRTSPFVAMEVRPGYMEMRPGFGNTLTWDLTPWVRTATRINDLQLTIRNLDPLGKKILVDQAYLAITYGPTAPKSSTSMPVTLFVLDGWNSTASATLVQTGMLNAVNRSDDVRAEVEPGAFAAYRFTRIPGGSAILSVKVHVEHHEEDGFASGAAVWRLGSGLLSSPTTLAQRLPVMLSGEPNEGTEVWGAYYAINTAALVNDLKFVVRNKDVSGKKTRIDRVSVVVTHKESGGSNPVPPPPEGPAVQVWLTTADASRLLSREPDARFAAEQVTGTPVIDVDATTMYQEMVGFGAAITDASAWLIQNKLTVSQREALLRDLFGRNPGIGLSFTRLTMGASDFSLRHYSYDDMPTGESDPALARFSIEPNRADVLPVVKAALAINPQLQIMASPWSAPGWMKTSGSLIGGTLRAEAYGPFAEYFRRYIEAYGAEGVPIHAISVQNEPHHEPSNYPGMRLEPPARARFIGQHLGPLFERSGIQTRILDWDHNWDEYQSPLQVLADSAAHRYIAGVAWHCYGGDVFAQTLVHEARPDKDAYVTECSGGESSPGFADNLKWVVRTLIVGATRGWAKGVLVWNLALDEQHGPHTGGCWNCRGVVTIGASGAVTRNVEYYALAHASRFVRPGARRIASTTGIEGLESVAFRNADDGSKVLIVVNTAAVSRTFAVRAVGQIFRHTLSAGAVATFAWP